MSAAKYAGQAIVLGTGLLSVSDAVEGVEGGVVGSSEGVEVLLGGSDAAVSESFFDGSEVGAAGEEPGSVGVAEVVGSDGGRQSGSGEGRLPDVAAVPVARGVPVGPPGLVGLGQTQIAAIAGDATRTKVFKETGLQGANRPPVIYSPLSGDQNAGLESQPESNVFDSEFPGYIVVSETPGRSARCSVSTKRSELGRLTQSLVVEGAR